MIRNPYIPLEIQTGWEVQSYSPARKEVWQPISLPHFVRADGEKNSVYHYRFRFTLTERPRIPLAVIPGKITDVDRTYLNGTLIGAEGRVTPRERASDVVRLYYLPVELLYISDAEAKENEILVEVFTGAEGGGISEGPFLLGPQQLLQQALFYRQLPMLLFGVLTVVFAIFFLQLYFFHRYSTSLFYLTLLCLPVALYWIFETQFKYSLPLSHLNLLRIQYFLLFILPVPTSLFLSSLPRSFQSTTDRASRLMLFLRILPLFFPLFCLVLLFGNNDSRWLFWRDFLFLPLTLMTGVLLEMDLIRRAITGGAWGMRVLTGGVIIVSLCVVGDLTAYLRLTNLPGLSPFGFIAFLAISAFVLQKKLTGPRPDGILAQAPFPTEMILDREQIRAEVDSKLNRASGEGQMHELLAALNGDQNASSTVRTSLVLPTDKSPESPDPTHCICAVDNLQLGGRNHVVSFILRDTDPGADSTTALVSGILFRVILDRTRRQGEDRQLPPELWLHLFCEDLRRSPRLPRRTKEPDLFLSLVDEQNGFFYYLLSGFPANRTGKEGKAEPLTEAPAHLAADPAEIHWGPDGGREGFRVGVFPLRGDEEIHVTAKTQTTGDDSLTDGGTEESFGPALRLTFQPAPSANEPDPEYRTHFQEALKQARDNRRTEAIAGFRRLLEKRPDLDAPAFNLAQLLKKENDLDQAVFYYEHSSRINPQEEKYIYQTALAHYRLRDYRRAAESALRLLLRNPHHAEALLLLTDVERRLKRTGRAGRYLERAAAILGDEPRIRQLRKLLKI